MKQQEAEKVWNATFSESGSQAWYPDEQLVRFTAGYVKKRLGLEEFHDFLPRTPKVLDVGCGRGRHVVFFAENGCETYGVDVSNVAIDFAEQWLKRVKLRAELKVGPIEELPYQSNFFDVAVCHGVLDHILIDHAAKGISEIHRVLAPKGLFFSSYISKDDCGWGKGTRLPNTNTWMIDEGYEKDAPQTFFDQADVENLLKSQFEIISINKVVLEAVHGRSLVGSDKEYPKDSRFYVVARKK